MVQLLQVLNLRINFCFWYESSAEIRYVSPMARITGHVSDAIQQTYKCHFAHSGLIIQLPLSELPFMKTALESGTSSDPNIFLSSVQDSLLDMQRSI